MPKFTIKAVEKKEIFKSPKEPYTEKEDLICYRHYNESIAIIEAETLADALQIATEKYEYVLPDGPGERCVDFEVLEESQEDE